MAVTGIKILGKSRVEGGGHDVNGVAKNDKIFVWGELTGTYAANGISFSPGDVGISGTFDFINLQAVTVNSVSFADTTQIYAAYDEANNLLHLMDDIDGNDEAGSTAFVVNFFACGSSGAAPDQV